MNDHILTSSPQAAVDARIRFLGRTYGMLALCVGAGSVGAWMAMGHAFPQAHPWIMLFLMIGGIFAVQALRHMPGVNVAALLGFGALSGAAIAPLIAAVAAQAGGMAVAQAYLTAAAVFVGLSAYAFFSKKDFSFLKGFVWTGLIAVLVLGISNYFFFESGLLALSLSGISVVLFSAFILYDTSSVLREYPNDEYIAAALTLYLDVFLLFEHMLVLFGVLGED